MKEKRNVRQGALPLMGLETLDVLGPLHGYGIAPAYRAHPAGSDDDDSAQRWGGNISAGRTRCPCVQPASQAALSISLQPGHASRRHRRKS